jgi:phage baseplate assembly protein V
MNPDLGAMIRPLAMKVANMLARAKVTSVKATTKMQTLQVAILAGEDKDRLEHYEPYGFTSHPHPGAEVLTAFLDGDRSHGVALVVADRKYRLTTLEEGEVTIHDDLNQKVHLTRAGIIVEGGGLPMIFRDTPSMLFQADTEIRFETATFRVVTSALSRFETPKTENTGLLNTQQMTIGAVPGGVGLAIATMNGGTVNYNNVNFNYAGGTVTYALTAISSDGRRIDGSHTHPVSGGSTLIPNP